MKRHFQLAIPLVFFVILLLTGCQNPESMYSRGKYSRAIAVLERKGNLNSNQYLLKARCHEALGETSGVSNCYASYLLTEPAGNARAEAVQGFINYNQSDSLSVLVLQPQDGEEAQICLYKAYCNLGRREEAKQILTENIALFLSFDEYTALLVDYQCDDAYACEIFGFWFKNMEEDQEKLSFISLLDRFVSSRSLVENLSKSLLQVTDSMMADEFYTQDNIRLSLLLKIKGNLLEKLYDKVNAKLYWSQALKLNPQDEELRNKIK